MDYRIIDSPEAIVAETERLGFLPFFENEVPGFSLAEHTPPALWFSDTLDGPWEWKGPVARTRRCVYGKFFKGRAGFISLECFPAFANYRRDGYDFDALYDDGLAPYRDKALYELLPAEGSVLSTELKRLGGYGKDGAKGFDTILTRLQMQSYVCIADFQYAQDRHGKPYGWGLARYATPEALFGTDWKETAYREDPVQSRRRIYERLLELVPGATEKNLRRLLGDK